MWLEKHCSATQRHPNSDAAEDQGQPEKEFAGLGWCIQKTKIPRLLFQKDTHLKWCDQNTDQTRNTRIENGGRNVAFGNGNHHHGRGYRGWEGSHEQKSQPNIKICP